MPKQINKKRYRIFLVLTLAFPFFVFSMLELGLRAIDYGINLDLFVPAEEGYSDKDLLMVNPDVAHRYFSQSTSTPRPPHELFLKEKPENGYRIFMLGGSTTAGWPFPNNAMSSRVLNIRLSDAFPDLYVEVINTGIAAINSHTLLDFMDEILDQEPDAILIYAGHNEFYGALGAGSTESLGGMRWFIRFYLTMLDFKTVQWLRDSFNDLKRWMARNVSEKDGNHKYPTLMGEMIGEQNIPYRGPIYLRAKEQFQANLRDILRLAKEAGLPVLMSELVSNLRDIQPFVSTETVEFEQADVVFQQAKKLEENGEYESALESYYRAKDLDGLRFRASEEFNEVIRNTAAEYQVPVVPMKAYFEGASPNNLIGFNLMLEHLHPNADGYILMADAFFDSLRQHRFIDANWKTKKLKPATFYAERWPVTEYDRALAKIRIIRLMDSWPFRPPSDPGTAYRDFVPNSAAEELAYKTTRGDIGFIDGHIQMAKYYEAAGEVQLAYREFEALIRSAPFDAQRYVIAAKNQFENENFEKSLRLLKSSLMLKDTGAANKWSGNILIKFSWFSNAYIRHRNMRATVLV